MEHNTLIKLIQHLHEAEIYLAEAILVRGTDEEEFYYLLDACAGKTRIVIDNIVKEMDDNERVHR